MLYSEKIKNYVWFKIKKYYFFLRFHMKVSYFIVIQSLALFFWSVAAMHFCSLIISPEFHKANQIFICIHYFVPLCLCQRETWKQRRTRSESRLLAPPQEVGARGVERVEDRRERRGGICSDLPLVCPGATRYRPPPAASQVDRATSLCCFETNQRKMLNWWWLSKLRHQ